jgi:hypothetical protein
MTLEVVDRVLRSWALEGFTERVDLDASGINPDPGGEEGVAAFWLVRFVSVRPPLKKFRK